MTNPIIEEAIVAMMKVTGWSDAECRNFLSCLRAPTPDALLESIPLAIEHAAKIEAQEAFVSLMKSMGRVVEAEFRDGQFFGRITPNAEVEVSADGAQITINYPGLAGTMGAKT